MALTVTLAGVTRAIDEGSLAIAQVANGVDRLTCRVTSVDGSATFDIDDTVSVVAGAETIFGGRTITPVEEGFGGVGLEPITTTIEAQDFNALTERRVVTDTMPAGTLKAALLVLLPYLSPYGVTLDAAQVAGPPLPALVYDAKILTEVFAELQRLSGYVREIGPTGVLRMFAPGAEAAPFNITDGDGHVVGDISIRPTRSGYANRVIVKAGSGTATVTQTWTANGSAETWVGDLPAAGPGVTGVLTLVLGGVTTYATVDVVGSPGGWFHWDWTTRTLSKNTYPGTWPLPAGMTMAFPYVVQYPFTVQADHAAEQAAHGLWEMVVALPDVFDIPRAQANADAELVRCVARSSIEARYVTYDAGLKPGQTQSITASWRHTSGTFLITEIRITDVGPLLRYAVTAIRGTTVTGSFRDTYVAWGGGSSLVAIGGITGGGGGGTSASLLSTHLGGSRSELVISAAWTPIVHYQTYRCLSTGTYIFRTEAMTTDVGTSVSVRLWDVTASAVVTGGTVAASTATAWAESMLTVALLEGHRYRAELLGSNALAPVIVGQATVEPAVADAAVDYWAENRPAAGTARSLPTALFPTGNWWRQDISAVSLDARSTALCNFCAGGAPDLGGDPGLDLGLSTDWGNNYGFPYCTVSGNHPKIVFSHINYSGGASGDDERGYPIPLQALTEAGWTEDLAGTVSAPTWLNEADAFKDRHLLIYDVDNDYLYEIYQPFYNNSATPRNVEIDPGGGADLLYPYGTAVIPAYGFACASCSWWDAKTNNVRPDGVTSSDAAGLQVLPGLVNYDEIISGDPILHAHRLCLFSNSSDTPKYVWPATHEAGSWTANHPPLGTRFRLKASWDASSEYAVCQTFITALKTYGLIFVDRGGHGMVSGTNDPRWGDSDDYPRLQLVDTISRIDFTDLEVVTLGWGEP